MSVTALLVTHDGARWLPAVLDGLRRQTHPVDHELIRAAAHVARTRCRGDNHTMAAAARDENEALRARIVALEAKLVGGAAKKPARSRSGTIR